MSTKEYVDGRHMGLVVLQGLVTLVFGVVALFFPGLVLTDLLLLFAVYVTVVGVVELVHGFQGLGKSGNAWFPLLVGGVLVGAGVYLVRHPAMELNGLLVLMGALLMVRGVADLFVSAFLSGKSEHRMLWVVSGVVGVIAGLLLWRYPVVSGLDFVWVLGLYALVAGSVTLALAMRVRG